MASFDLEVGQTVSHFRMEKKLGEGGMGAVYLAEDLTLSRRVAIKFMSRALLVAQGNEAVRESLEKRFIREAKSAAAINHPNLAQIYEANFDTDNWYIAMEYIDGLSLYDQMTKEKKKFTVDEIVSICRQVVSGLEFAWDNYTIIHRDIKPHNIMLTKNKLVKIVDLGLAKPIASDDTHAEMPDLTGAGTPIGTPQYMAPEQATGQKDINYLVDVFALGATMYEVCSGKKAFSGNTAPMIYMSQVQKKYTPLKELRSDLPEGLVNIINHMMEPKPEDRIASYPAILAALNTVPTSSDLASGATLTQAYSKTMVGQMSGKTMGIEQPTLYHATDQLIKGRYRILKIIGKSRTGIEYHCLDTQLSVECSVKSIFPGREFPAHEMPRVKENFQRLMGFSHPNLVQIRDLTQDDATGEFFVVMETLPGHNLRAYTHRLKNELDSIDVKAIQSVLLLVAKALDNVSKTFGAIDHDLTPENIYLIKNDTQVKLMDFGITQPSPEILREVNPKDHFRFPLATPDYMAPELWQRKAAARQADLYSLGVIVYEMLSDKLPFWLKDPIPDSLLTPEMKKLPEHEQQFRYLFDRVVTEAPKPLPRLKRHENAAILKALAKDPHQRFASGEEFVMALQGKGGLMTAPKIAAAAAMLVLVAVGSFSIMKMLRSPPEPTPTRAVAHATSKSAKPKVTPGDTGAESQTADASQPADHEDEADSSQEAMDAAIQQVAMVTQREEDAAKKAKLLEMQAEAAKLETAFGDVRKGLTDNAYAVELTPQVDELYESARKKVAEGAFADAVTQFGEAIALANNVIRQAEEKKLTAMLQVKNEAVNLGKTFEQIRQELAAHERLAPKLTDAIAIATQAQQALTEEKFTDAIRDFKKAISQAEDLSTEAKKERRAQAEAAQKIAEESRAKLDKYKGLAADLTEAMVKVDVILSLGRTELNQEEFDTALEQFNKAQEDCKAIIALAETKFKAILGQPFTDPKSGVDFVWIEPLKFWVSRYEITNAQYRRYKPTHTSRKDTMSGLSLNGDQQPVAWITYYDAVGFCEWLKAVSARDAGVPDGYIYRLPSRDEWITLARCGVDRLYPWGSNWPPTYGNFGNQELFPSTWQLDGYTDEFPVTCPVDKSGKNEWGLYGITGNVWEWTTNLKDDRRAVMGGGWTDVNRSVLFINMDKAYASMSESYDNIGIRVLLAPEAPQGE